MDYLEYMRCIYQQARENESIIAHSGVKGMSWGDRKYQYEDGSLTPLGKKHYGVGDGRDKKETDKKPKQNSSSSDKTSKPVNKTRSVPKAKAKTKRDLEKELDQERTKAEAKDQAEQEAKKARAKKILAGAAIAAVLATVLVVGAKKYGERKGEAGARREAENTRLARLDKRNERRFINQQRDREFASRDIRSYSAYKAQKGRISNVVIGNNSSAGTAIASSASAKVLALVGKTRIPLPGR